MDEDFEPHLQELRRGTVVLACLRLLLTPGYGYGLLQDLESAGFDTEANTLYPLLRRLEKQGYLTSHWDTAESRPRKFYQTSPAGRRLTHAMQNHWDELSRAIAELPDDPQHA